MNGYESTEAQLARLQGASKDHERRIGKLESRLDWFTVLLVANLAAALVNLAK